MNKKIGVTLLATLILASAHLSDAQQAKKVPRVGFLAVSQQPYLTRDSDKASAS